MSGPTVDVVQQVIDSTVAVLATAIVSHTLAVASRKKQLITGPAAHHRRLRSMLGGQPGKNVSAWPAATLLGRLAEPTSRVILRLGTPVTFPPGTRLIHIGANEDHSYLLTRGCVKVQGNDGVQEPLLDVRMAGDLVGEMATLTGATRTATVTACTTVIARRIAGNELRELMGSTPHLAAEIAIMLTRRLRWANDRRMDLRAKPPAGRISRILLALNDIYADITTANTIPLTQAEVASLAGVSLATAETTLRTLQRKGAVRLGYRQIVIIDTQILTANTGES